MKFDRFIQSGLLGCLLSRANLVSWIDILSLTLRSGVSRELGILSNILKKRFLNRDPEEYGEKAASL